MNDILINSNQLIEMSTNSNVNIKFKIIVYKQANVDYGTCRINIGVFTNGNFIQKFSPVDIDMSAGSTGPAPNFLTFTLNDFDVSLSGNSYLAANIQMLSGASNSYDSNKIFITKTLPVQFNINPSSVDIPCGILQPVKFSVINVYNTLGNLTYNWSAPGWQGVINSSSSSITLTPTSPTVLPGVVSVTPILNGIPQPTNTCFVRRSIFTNTAVINGATSLCTGINSSIYSISNIGIGNSLNWSLSNSTIATISNITNNQVTVNRIGSNSGIVNLIATITNQCGQTFVVSKNIQFLNPAPINPANFIYAPFIRNEYCDPKWHYVEIDFPFQTGVTRSFISVTPNLGILPGTTQASVIIKFLRNFSGQFFYDISFNNGCTSFEYTSEDFPPL